MAPFLILVILVSGTSLITGHDVGDPCTPTGQRLGYTYRRHLLLNGDLGCCREITCKKGTYAVPCSTDNADSTTCRTCEDNTYMGNDDTSSLKNLKCSVKTACEQPQMITKDEGDKVENRLCGCNLENGYWNNDPSRNPYEPTDCSGPKNCAAGQELHLNGECAMCPWGEYKLSDRDHRCIAWSECRWGEELLENGTATTDGKCGIRTTVTTTDMHINTGSPQKASMEAGHIAGITIGVIVFIAALVGVIVGLLLYRRKKGRTPEKSDLDETGNLRKQPLPEDDDDDELKVEKSSVIYRPVLPTKGGFMSEGRGHPV